jgi:hypothetical protein
MFNCRNFVLNLFQTFCEGKGRIPLQREREGGRRLTSLIIHCTSHKINHFYTESEKEGEKERE